MVISIETGFEGIVVGGEHIKLFITILSYVIFSFTGSILKEIYFTNTKSGYEFQPHQVIVSTLVATLAALAINAYYFDPPQPWQVMVFISFALGMVGFELFKQLSSIEGIKKLLTFGPKPEEKKNTQEQEEKKSDEPHEPEQPHHAASLKPKIHDTQ